MVKIAHLDDAFSEIFELGASPVGGQDAQIINQEYCTSSFLGLRHYFKFCDM